MSDHKKINSRQLLWNKGIQLFLSASFLALPVTVSAQERTDSPAATPNQNAAPETARTGARIFEPAYFAQYAPNTALDMVTRLPGFSIEEAAQRRGLGQGGSNVLLNGERFTAKSTDIRTLLSRIGAKQVIRIELVDAATLDIPGLSGQVANLIYAASSGSGQFRWSPSFRTRQTDPVFLDGEVSYTGKLGKFDYTLSLVNRSFRDGNNGPERVLDGTGGLIDLRDEILFVDGDRPKISAALKRETTNGNIANLNLAYERSWTEIRELSDRTDNFRNYLETEKEYNYELGGDYEFGVSSGRLKLIGLHRFEHSPFFFNVLTRFNDGRADNGVRQNRFVDETESIARAEYRWKSGTNDWQVSLEGALNSLDTGTELSVLNSSGVYQPVPLFGADARVQEKRAETNITWGRPIASTITLQSSLGAEYSQLSQSGPAGLTRSFIRPKGFISAAWKAGKTLDVNLRIERSVGQLDFFDFVASTDIGSGNENVGNAQLVPQQSWDFEVEATKNLGQWGSIKLFGDYRIIEDIIGQIPIGEFGEAPGNIDGTRVYGLGASGTIKLDRAGIKGAEIEFSGNFREARLDDPLTGLRLPVSQNQKYQYDVSFRHDIPGTQWAYGGGYFAFGQEPGFRLNQISQFTFDNGDASIFAEHKNVLGLKVRATIANLTGTGEDFARTVFVNRRTGPTAFTEDRKRSFGQVVRLNVSGTF